MNNNVVMTEKHPLNKNDFELVVNNITREITVEELAGDIEMLIWHDGVEDFKVTENLSKTGKRSYLLKGLHMEIEDEIVYCDDCFNILSENYYALLGFLKNCVVKIYSTITANEHYAEIILDDGIIVIEVAY